MTHKVVFRPSARADLAAIESYVAERGGSASAFLDRMEHACMALADFPERGTIRDDIHPGLRLLGFERRASIAFIVESETVRILRIFYGGRDFPAEWSEL